MLATAERDILLTPQPRGNLQASGPHVVLLCLAPFFLCLHHPLHSKLSILQQQCFSGISDIYIWQTVLQKLADSV